jgi:hypothetical protein
MSKLTIEKMDPGKIMKDRWYFGYYVYRFSGTKSYIFKKNVNDPELEKLTYAKSFAKPKTIRKYYDTEDDLNYQRPSLAKTLNDF